MDTLTRHTAILNRARDRGKVSATALAKHLNVAAQTIRRDLRQLSDSGLLERVHGGAVLPSGTRNIRVRRQARAEPGRQSKDRSPGGDADPRQRVIVP